FNKIDGENVPVAPEFSFDVGRVEPISVGRENGDYVIKSDGFLSRKHFSLRIISGAQGKYSLEIKDLISFHGTNILWRASEDRQTGVPVSDNGSLGLIETSLPSSTPADEGIIAHNIGRLKSAEMVNTINGESMNGNAGENRAGVFMNVDSLGRIHSINEVEDANVTLSIVVSNKHSRNIIEISRSSGLRELTAEARNNIIRAAVRCNMMKITSVGLPTIAEGDGIINVLTGSEIKILRLLGNDQALVRSTDSKKDIIDGIVSVPDIVRLFSTGQFTITGESSGIPETLQAVPAEPLPVVAEIPIDTVEARRADVVEAFKDANGRSTDVRVVQGVPKGGMPSALSVANGVSRTLAKNRYGVLDGTMQIYLFEMDPDDSEQTARDKIETAITNASKGLAATGRVVVFAPEMANGKRLGDSVKKGANITVLNDAYTDYEYPDMAARMALARNISSYYESPAAETLAVISRLLEKIAQGNFKLDAIDDLFRLTLRIKPVDYNRDIAFWKNAQLATAVAA
ncbi:MAG: hypothetical protein NTZ95_04525, partial [Candidatus Omnitrophica bacterium]|nr:hypothetical protein [Candidatus Omnitrophota bacterium]